MSNSPWWVLHRRKHFKPRNRLSTEMIVRKSVAECMREYGSQCSIAGIREVFDKTIDFKARLLRIIVLVCTFTMVGYLLRHMWSETLTKPLVVTTESNTYHISNIDFPAIAFCNVNRISKKAVTEIAKEIYPYFVKRKLSLREVESFVLETGRLLDFSYNATLQTQKIMDMILIDQFDTHEVVQIMKRLAPKCEDMMLRCVWAGKIVDCASVFVVRRTVRGHCCSFNYVLDVDSAHSSNGTFSQVKRAHIPGVFHGLNVVLDPMVEDYDYPIYNFNGFDVLMFDPSHYADPTGGRVVQRFVEPNQVAYFEIMSIKQVASREVRKYPISIRKCLFHDEVRRFNRMYSYSACIVSCRIMTIQAVCKCTPYYLPISRSDGPVCTLNDLKCLNKYKEKIFYLYPLNVDNTEGLELELEDSLYCPHCLPDCELTRHISKSFKVSLNKKHFIKKFLRDFSVDGINITNKCFLSIFQSNSHGVLNRLDVVSYWFEILSNIGGFGGVLIGFSIFSAVELIYFTFIRFFQIFYRNYVKYH